MREYGFKEAIKSIFDNPNDVRTLDTGGAGFPDMIDEDMLYVDKTLLIVDILRRNHRGAFLYTRPRRFGKTTNLSMLEEFFDIRKKGTRCFDGLAISGPEFSRYDVHRNAYNVIRMDLKDVKSSGNEGIIESIGFVMSRVYRDFHEQIDWDSINPADAELYNRLLFRKADEIEIRHSALILSEILYRQNGKRTVFLIDEYDAPVTNCLGKGSYEAALDQLSSFLSATLKSNRYLEMAVLTGITQISKETMFSKLNNVIVNSIVEEMSDERFGFTEAEVREILEEAEHPEKFPEVKEWYDGYRFGNAEVYNPYSIINYVLRGCKEPQPFWINTSTDMLLHRLLTKLSEDNVTKLTRLVTGNSIVERMDMHMTSDNVTGSEESVFSLMTATGYLNARRIENDLFELSVPNKEVMQALRKIVKGIMASDDGSYGRFCKAVIENDAETMRDILEGILLDKSMFHLHHENSYGLVLTMVLDEVSGQYDIAYEEEDGNGRSDIVLRSKASDRPNIVFELKRVNDEKDLVTGADAALEQIHDRRYYAGMTGDVILIGLSFWKKFPYIVSEVINMERDWKRLRPNASDGPRP